MVLCVNIVLYDKVVMNFLKEGGGGKEGWGWDWWCGGILLVIIFVGMDLRGVGVVFSGVVFLVF